MKNEWSRDRRTYHWAVVCVIWLFGLHMAILVDQGAQYLTNLAHRPPVPLAYTNNVHFINTKGLK